MKPDEFLSQPSNDDQKGLFTFYREQHQQESHLNNIKKRPSPLKQHQVTKPITPIHEKSTEGQHPSPVSKSKSRQLRKIKPVESVDVGKWAYGI